MNKPPPSATCSHWIGPVAVTLPSVSPPLSPAGRLWGHANYNTGKGLWRYGCYKLLSSASASLIHNKNIFQVQSTCSYSFWWSLQMSSKPPQATPFPEHLNASYLHLLPLDIHVNPRCSWKIHRFVVFAFKSFKLGQSITDRLIHFCTNIFGLAWNRRDSGKRIVSQRFTSEAAHNTSWQPHT